MKKLKLMAFVIGLLLANVAGFAQVPTFDWLRKVKETNSLKRSINNPLPDATISEYRYKNNSK